MATRVGRHATVGLSSHYAQAADLTRALEEAELVLGVTAAGGGAPVEEIGGGTYRLLFRVMASHPQEVRSFYEDTVSALVKLRRAVLHRPARARSTPTSRTTAT